MMKANLGIFMQQEMEKNLGERIIPIMLILHLSIRLSLKNNQ